MACLIQINFSWYNFDSPMGCVYLDMYVHVTVQKNLSTRSCSIDQSCSGKKVGMGCSLFHHHIVGDVGKDQ